MGKTNVFQVIEGDASTVVLETAVLSEALTESERINSKDLSYGQWPSTAVNYIDAQGYKFRITTQEL